jgi:hypothetical protein
MEREGSLPHSQALVSSPYPEPEQSIPCLTIPLLEDSFYYYHPSTTRSSMWSLSIRSPHQSPLCTSLHPHTCHMPHPSPWFDHPDNINPDTHRLFGVRGGAVGWGTALQAGRLRVRLEFFIDIILLAALLPWGWLRNIFWGGGGGKDGRCVRLTTLPSSCSDCLEIWELQPPWILRACPGLQCVCFTHRLVKDKILTWSDLLFSTVDKSTHTYQAAV